MAGVKSSFYQKHVNGRDFYGPKFHFPTMQSITHPQITEETTTNQISTTIKTALTKIHETLMKVRDQSVNNTNRNNTVLIDEMANSNDTIIGLTENTNSTVLKDLVQNNDTINDVMNTNGTFDTNGTGLFTSSIENATKNVVSYVTDSTQDFISNLTSTKKYDWSHEHNDDRNLTMSHQDSDSKDHYGHTTYIILGIVIVILLIACVVIAYVYITYKKRHLLPTHAQYSVSHAKDVSSSSAFHSTEQTVKNDNQQSSFKC